MRRAPYLIKTPRRAGNKYTRAPAASSVFAAFGVALGPISRAAERCETRLRARLRRRLALAGLIKWGARNGRADPILRQAIRLMIMMLVKRAARAAHGELHGERRDDDADELLLHNSTKVAQAATN
jgi:hypothetical protein